MSAFQMLNEVRCAPGRTLHRLLTQITLNTRLTTCRKVFPHRTFPADLPSALGLMTFGHSINALRFTIVRLLKQMQIILMVICLSLPGGKQDHLLISGCGVPAP